MHLKNPASWHVELQIVFKLIVAAQVSSACFTSLVFNLQKILLPLHIRRKVLNVYLEFLCITSQFNFFSFSNRFLHKAHQCEERWGKNFFFYGKIAILCKLFYHAPKLSLCIMYCIQLLFYLYHATNASSSELYVFYILHHAA